jgi:acyl-CoA synthetase (AMP-forming)/AMP-acid ligase II
MIGLETYYGFSNVLRTLWSGGLVATAIRWEEIPAAIPLYGINYVSASPAQLARLLQHFAPGTGPFAGMQIVEIGGSTLPAPLAAAARAQLGGEIRVSYGASELGFVAAGRLDALADRPGAVGWIGPGIEAQAVDDAHRPLPAGTEGRIRIRSAAVVDGYIGDAAATAASFRDGWFYPDDIGTVGEDGLLTIAGRTGEMINAGGTKVSPRRIEAAVLEHPDIAEAAAFATAGAAGVTEIWVAIVQRRPVDLDALLRRCFERIGHGAPRRVLVAERLPRNAMGKVPVDELVKMAAAAAPM